MNPIQTPAPITIVTLPATILTRAMVSALSACALTAELREAVSDALEEPFPGEELHGPGWPDPLGDLRPLRHHPAPDRPRPRQPHRGVTGSRACC